MFGAMSSVRPGESTCYLFRAQISGVLVTSTVGLGLVLPMNPGTSYLVLSYP